MQIKISTIILFSCFGLTGCGDSTSSSASKTVSVDSIEGLVINEAGPVASGKIEGKDRDGRVIAKTELNGDGHYKLVIPVGSAYPLVLHAYPSGSDETLTAVVTSELAEEQDISQVSTIVVETAMSLGGLTEANIAKAAGAAIAQRKNSGGAGSSAGFKGDPTKHYGGWH